MTKLCVKDGVCDKVVCGQCVVKRGAAEEAEEEAARYRTKNKNPIQKCGENITNTI